MTLSNSLSRCAAIIYCGRHCINENIFHVPFFLSAHCYWLPFLSFLPDISWSNLVPQNSRTPLLFLLWPKNLESDFVAAVLKQYCICEAANDPQKLNVNVHPHLSWIVHMKVLFNKRKKKITSNNKDERLFFLGSKNQSPHRPFPESSFNLQVSTDSLKFLRSKTKDKCMIGVNEKDLARGEPLCHKRGYTSSLGFEKSVLKFMLYVCLPNMISFQPLVTLY